MLTTKKISLVLISELIKNPYQPRNHPDKAELDGLALSIIENGLLQPIVISKEKNYIIAGHRRVAAHEILKLKKIPAITVTLSDEELRILSLVENIQREDLSTIELAIAIQGLVDTGLTHEVIADKLGKHRTTISQLVKIATIDKSVVDYISEKNMKTGISWLYEAVKVDPKKQLKVLKHIENKAITRDELRDYVKKLNGEITKTPYSPRVSFKIKRNKNKVSMSFNMKSMKADDKEKAIVELESVLKELRELNIAN